MPGPQLQEKFLPFLSTFIVLSWIKKKILNQVWVSGEGSAPAPNTMLSLRCREGPCDNDKLPASLRGFSDHKTLTGWRNRWHGFDGKHLPLDPTGHSPPPSIPDLRQRPHTQPVCGSLWPAPQKAGNTWNKSSQPSANRKDVFDNEKNCHWSLRHWEGRKDKVDRAEKQNKGRKSWHPWLLLEPKHRLLNWVSSLLETRRDSRATLTVTVVVH